MTPQAPSNAAQPTPKRKQHLSRAVKAGAAITVGVLLVSSAGSLASWSQTVKGQDVNIQAGTLVATIAQQPAELGRLAVELAVKAIKGETIEKTVPVEVVAVTKANVGDFIK